MGVMKSLNLAMTISFPRQNAERTPVYNTRAPMRLSRHPPREADDAIGSEKMSIIPRLSPLAIAGLLLNASSPAGAQTPPAAAPLRGHGGGVVREGR